MEKSDAPGMVLDVQNIRVSYGDIVALRDVSLGAWQGQVTAVLGRNGAGKTTALCAVAGIMRPSAGSITYRGESIGRLPAHRRARLGIAYVEEGRKIFRRRTVEENLLLGGYARTWRKKELHSLAEDVYDVFPVLASRRHETAGVLSGGQQQMLAIGQALMASPSVLLLDEPSNGLSPAIAKEVEATVARLKVERGLSVVLVEQAVEAAIGIADWLVVIELGRTVLSCSAHRPGVLEEIREAYMGGGGASRRGDGDASR